MQYTETIQQQLALPHAYSSGFAPRGTRDLVVWLLALLVKSRRLTTIYSHADKESSCVEATDVHGMATIWNADILVWAAPQTIHAHARKLRQRLLATKQHQTPTFMWPGQRVHSRMAASEQPSPYRRKGRNVHLLRPRIES
ncbi:replication initiator protein A [Mesorhizobium sp. ISC25]|uniref:replication initiator protein A n=1 Tax=Mesorhizobium sp. ISC25 TaxID=3077335 RepID=UPI0035D5C100